MEETRTAAHSWIRGNALGLVAIFIALHGTAVAVQTAGEGKAHKAGAENAAKKKAKRGPAGPAGPQGPQGQQGLPGTSIFESTIPSGTTIRGAFVANDVANDTDGSAIALGPVSFPVPAPADLADNQINFAPTVNASDDDATCTGDPVAPTAPAGKVCLYMDGYVGAAGAASGENITDGAASRFGFQIVVAPGSAANPSRAATDGAWAYTAP